MSIGSYATWGLSDKIHAMTPEPRELTPPGQPDRALLKDRAYAALKEMIQTGVFAPNAFLSERLLSERLGMSKTPIRSALELLEVQGLVAVSPRQGIVVKELSAREITDLFEMRGAIEPMVVSRLAARSPGGGPPGLDANLATQAEAAALGDALAATGLDVEFHLLLAGWLDNREAVAWLSRCFDKLHRSILRISRQAPGRLAQSHRDHSGIAAAVRSGRPEEAARLMGDHLDYGRRFLLGG